MKVHARVCPTLARNGADQCLAAVVEQLEGERRLELGAKSRRKRLGGREADTVVEVAAGVPAELARLVSEPPEEARGAGVHRRAEIAGHLELERARPRAAVQHDAAVLLEGAVEAEPARHDVIGERHVRDLAAPDAHGADRLEQDRRASRLVGEAGDVERAGRDVHGCELPGQRREEIAEGWQATLRRDQIRLRRAGHPSANGVVVAQLGRPDTGGRVVRPVVRRARLRKGERLEEPRDVGRGGRPRRRHASSTFSSRGQHGTGRACATGSRSRTTASSPTPRRSRTSPAAPRCSASTRSG